MQMVFAVCPPASPAQATSAAANAPKAAKTPPHHIKELCGFGGVLIIINSDDADDDDDDDADDDDDDDEDDDNDDTLYLSLALSLALLSSLSSPPNPPMAQTFFDKTNYKSFS